MKLLLVFFTLVGVSYALVPGNEYVYQYEGQIKIGMPEIRRTVAAAGITCKINLQVQDDECVAVKLTEVKVAESVADVKCENRDRIDMPYADVTGHANLLESVFKIYPGRERNDVVETNKQEEVWIANVKKAIANLFNVEPIRNNFRKDSLDMMEISNHGHSVIDEPSIFGYCKSDYSMVQLNNTDRSPGYSQHRPVQPRPWTNYEMSRTINFDECQESVKIKQTAMGNTSESHLTQFGDVQSRHSVLRHNLTFDGQYFILQNGTNEGHFAINPFGMNSEKIISVSNQTYHLVSVNKIGGGFWRVEEPLKIMETWYAELSSAYEPGPQSPEFIRYLYINDARYEPFSEETIMTGVNVYNYMDQLKDAIEYALSDSADIIMRVEKPTSDHNIDPSASDSSRLTTNLELALRIARSLSITVLQQKFDDYSKDTSQKGQIKLRLFIDTLGASGTGGPLNVFIENASKGKITPQRAASVFFSMPNNLITTSVIKEMETYVKSLSLDSYPFSTATIWINYARTINKACVHSQKVNYTVPYEVLGNEHCNQKEATDILLPFLEDQLKNTEEEWKQIVLIRAIGNLGSSRGITILESYAEHEGRNSTVRVAAVYALGQKTLIPRFRKHVLNTFMSISENRTDNIYVRQACILAILSWKPPRSFYQTLASSSWIENSDQMSSFTYFILKSYAESSDPAIAEQAQVARFFLPLTKPYAPSSRYSYSRLLSIYDSKVDLVTDFDVSSLRAGRYSDSIQRQVLAFLVNSFGGYRFSVAQSSISYDERDWHSLLQKMTKFITPKETNTRTRSPKRRTNLALKDVQYRMTLKQSDSPSLATYFLSLFDNMELLIPLNVDSLSKAFGNDGSLLLKELQEDDTGKYMKFINPATTSLGIPTELGLPLITKFSLPTFTGGPIKNLSLTADGQECRNIYQLVRAKEIRLDVDSNYKFASKALISVRVLMPWTVRTAMASVSALKAVNLPARVTLTLNKEDARHQNLSISVIPRTDQQYAAAEFHTIPSVLTKHMFPIEKVDQIKTITLSASGSRTGTEYVRTPINESLTGINGYLRWEADVSYPFTQGNFLTLVRQPNLIPALFTSPTCRMLEATFIADFTKSKTKEIHSSTAIRIDTPTQKSLHGELPVFQFKSTLLLNGSETRYYEAEVRNSELSQSGSRHSTNLTINYKRSQLPRYDSNPAGYCLYVKRDGPKIRNFDDLRKALQSSQNSEIDLNGELKGGSGANACDQRHIASVTGTLKISDERRSNLSHELDTVCSYDPNDPTVTFVTAPVYDRLTVDISYSDSVPRVLQNATYWVYDVVRGWTFPHSYSNYMDQEHNPPKKISIRGDRYLSQRRWRVEAKMPTETSKLDNLKVPSVIESIVPVGGIEPSSSQSRFDLPKRLFESKLSNECIITKNKVRMFDGNSYNYASEGCEAYAIIDTRSKDGPTLMTGIEQDTKKFKALLGFYSTGTTVSISEGIAAVNGKVVGLTDESTTLKSSSGETLGEALRTRNYVQVKISGAYDVKVYDNQVVVTPYENMKGYYAGLCGNYDDAKHLEMIGPKRCIYSDPKLFAYAWTTYNGVGCDYTYYKAIKEKVHKFQEHCKKVPTNN